MEHLTLTVTAYLILDLKYGFCKKSLLPNVPQSDGQRYIRKEVTSYKIHTLGHFLSHYYWPDVADDVLIKTFLHQE